MFSFSRVGKYYWLTHTEFSTVSQAIIMLTCIPNWFMCSLGSPLSQDHHTLDPITHIPQSLGSLDTLMYIPCLIVCSLLLLAIMAPKDAPLECFIIEVYHCLLELGKYCFLCFEAMQLDAYRFMFMVFSW